MSTQLSEFWDHRYQKDNYVYGKSPNDFLVAQALYIKGKVLCLAEGEGRNAVYLAKQGCEVVAVDASSVGLCKADALAKENDVKITCVQADLSNYDLGENEYDAIVSIWCHVPPEVREVLHQKVIKALKPEGYFLLEAYHPDQLQYQTGGPQNPQLMMTTESLQRELAGLDFKICQRIVRDVHEGEGHFGTSAVVDCLAQKP
jgi:SAM-dependent methyltransferase